MVLHEKWSQSEYASYKASCERSRRTNTPFRNNTPVPELKTRTAEQMGILVGALGSQVRTLRTYKDEPPEEADDTKEEGTN